jgi:hypothetical protein
VRAQVVVEGGEEATEVELSRAMRSADAKAAKARKIVDVFIITVGSWSWFDLEYNVWD